MKLISIKFNKDKYFIFSIIHINNNFYWKIEHISNNYRCTKQLNINRFPHWKHKIEWNIKKLKLKIKNEEYKICEGCGEGISKYRIEDPNDKNKHFNCCDNCIYFYDINHSKKKIIKWKNKKPYMR